LLEGCTNGICAGGCVAGADIDLFGCAGACAVVIDAVGYVAGNTMVFFAGLTGSFGGIVVHRSLSFQSQKSEKTIRLSCHIVCPISPFYTIGAKFAK
jgi:hypothetical protein